MNARLRTGVLSPRAPPQPALLSAPLIPVSAVFVHRLAVDKILALNEAWLYSPRPPDLATASCEWLVYDSSVELGLESLYMRTLRCSMLSLIASLTQRILDFAVKAC